MPVGVLSFRHSSSTLGLRVAKPCDKSKDDGNYKTRSPRLARCLHALSSRKPRRSSTSRQRRGISLPTYDRLIRWSDRVMHAPAPLFPGYVFVNVSDRERIRLLETGGVVYLVSSAGQPVTLSDFEIEQLRAPRYARMM